MMYKLLISTARLISCVIINITLDEGQEASEIGEQSSKIFVAGTASRKFWLRAPQK